MKIGDRFERSAARIAGGSLGYGWRGLSALLGVSLAKELTGALIGISIMAAMAGGMVLLSMGLDMLGHAVAPKPIAAPVVALAREVPKQEPGLRRPR